METKELVAAHGQKWQARKTLVTPVASSSPWLPQITKRSDYDPCNPFLGYNVLGILFGKLWVDNNAEKIWFYF